MKTVISFNKWQLYGKIVLQLILLGVIYLFVCLLFEYGLSDSKMILVLIITLGFLFLLFFNLTQLIYLPIKVIIEDSNKLIISYLLRKSRVIIIDDIESFHFTRISTKSTLYDGIVVNLKKGKTVLFSNFNLKDYLPLRQFIENTQIPYLGVINFKPVSVYRNSL